MFGGNVTDQLGEVEAVEFTAPAEHRNIEAGKKCDESFAGPGEENDMQRLIGSRCAQPFKGAVAVFPHGRPIHEAAMDDNANRDIRLKSLLEFRPIARMLISAAR